MQYSYLDGDIGYSALDNAMEPIRILCLSRLETRLNFIINMTDMDTPEALEEIPNRF